MINQIRHRRLYAFFHNKAMSTLVIFLSSVLPLLRIVSPNEPFVASIALAFALMLGYSCWFWIAKPAAVIVNRWLANLSSCFAIYMMAVVAMNTDNLLWISFPLVCAVIVIFVASIRKYDEEFVI